MKLNFSGKITIVSFTLFFIFSLSGNVHAQRENGRITRADGSGSPVIPERRVGSESTRGNKEAQQGQSRSVLTARRTIVGTSSTPSEGIGSAVEEFYKDLDTTKYFELSREDIKIGYFLFEDNKEVQSKFDNRNALLKARAELTEVGNDTSKFKWENFEQVLRAKGIEKSSAKLMVQNAKKRAKGI